MSGSSVGHPVRWAVVTRPVSYAAITSWALRASQPLTQDTGLFPQLTLMLIIAAAAIAFGLLTMGIAVACLAPPSGGSLQGGTRAHPGA